MSNDYLQPDIASVYEQLPRLIEPLLGYPFVFRALGLATNSSAHLLDYRCGTGNSPRSYVTRLRI